MQNKPNFQDVQMNINPYITTDYKNISDWTLGENKPNSNPIKANFQKDKMNIKLYVIEDYRKKDDFTVRINKPNSNPISEKPKTNVNLFTTKDYENKSTFRPEKNKPKQTQFQTRRRSFCLLQKRLLHACGRILVLSGKDLLKYVSRQTAKQ